MTSSLYQRTLQRLSTLLAVIALTLVLLAGLTGILLAFYYEPTAGGAFDSLRMISEFVSGGTLIRSLHDLAGNGIIGVALLQIIVLFLSRQFRPSWLTAWISGIALTLTAIGLGWTAIILDWDQIGYWRLKVELGIISAVPVIGERLRDILVGGDAIGTTTVAHMYTLHSYVLAAVSVALAVLHLGALVYQEWQLARMSGTETAAVKATPTAAMALDTEDAQQPSESPALLKS
ncbi:MAG: cytochrome bc complex cytochrome b subunit [Synechococcales cyanobacterium C42_A2020_086]|jgi:cytochrome b6|nr:cytochrome bc complex cytochrome b subunit [Synechococcales cyanobacterium M58_A2018_015]MBF2075831.1 cytochrome bc complex cytochrome b subunit [Synechococcales cyanobacterium C42_A2020_086]